MRNQIWEKSILSMVALLVALPFVNIVKTADADSYNDRAITSNVENKIQADSQLMGSTIYVETKDGEVTLKGVVNSQADISRVGQHAYFVDGVKKVDNQLKTVNSNGFKAKPGMTDCQIGANWC